MNVSLFFKTIFQYRTQVDTKIEVIYGIELSHGAPEVRLTLPAGQLPHSAGLYEHITLGEA